MSCYKESTYDRVDQDGEIQAWADEYDQLMEVYYECHECGEEVLDQEVKNHSCVTDIEVSHAA